MAMGETRVRVSADGRLSASGQSVPPFAGDPGEYRLAPGPYQTFLLSRHRDDPKSRAVVLMMGELVHRMTVVEVMNIVTSAQWTGELHVLGPDGGRALGVAQGALTQARTDYESERIGELLVRAGLLTRAQLSELLPQKSSDERFGQLLVRRGILDDKQLFKQLQQQAETIFYAAMLMERGSYWFVVPPESASVSLTAFHLSIQGLLMEGVQRIDEMALFRERIPDNRVYPAAVAGARTDGLEGAALVLLKLCDGTRTIDDLARATGSGEFLTLKAVYGLLRGGQLKLRRGPTLDGHSAQKLLRQYNAIARDVFVAVATYGSMQRTSEALSSWLGGSPHGRLLGDSVDIDGTLDPSIVLIHLERAGSDDPMQELHQALHELAAYALFLASNGLPRNEERKLSRDVKARLAAMTL